MHVAQQNMKNDAITLAQALFILQRNTIILIGRVQNYSQRPHLDHCNQALHLRVIQV